MTIPYELTEKGSAAAAAPGYRADLTREVVGNVLAGHATYTLDSDDTPCMCTGCRIVRAAYLPGGEHR